MPTRKDASAGSTRGVQRRAAVRPSPLKSMRVSPSFQAFALDQLGGVRDLRARAMFGGIGLYSGDHFFGLMAADTLYLKVGDSNRKAYEEAGSRPFQPYADRPMTMPYYNVPANVIEDASILVNWARDSIAIASASSETSTKTRRRKH